MKEKETFDIKVDIFNAVVTVHLGTFDELKSYVKRKFNLILDSEDLSIDGFLADLDKDYGISGSYILTVKNFMHIKRDLAIGILAHESLHAVRAIFRSRGIPFTGENEETIAYTQEYIIESVLKQVKKLEKEKEAELEEEP